MGWLLLWILWGSWSGASQIDLPSALDCFYSLDKIIGADGGYPRGLAPVFGRVEGKRGVLVFTPNSVHFFDFNEVDPIQGQYMEFYGDTRDDIMYDLNACESEDTCRTTGMLTDQNRKYLSDHLTRHIRMLVRRYDGRMDRFKNYDPKDVPEGDHPESVVLEQVLERELFGFFNKPNRIGERDREFILQQFNSYTSENISSDELIENLAERNLWIESAKEKTKGNFTFKIGQINSALAFEHFLKDFNEQWIDISTEPRPRRPKLKRFVRAAEVCSKVTGEPQVRQAAINAFAELNGKLPPNQQLSLTPQSEENASDRAE